MKNSTSITDSQNSLYLSENISNTSRSSQLMQLFEEELNEIYWAEIALNKAIPKMIKYALHIELIESLEHNLIETKHQATRMELIIQSINIKSSNKICIETEELMKEAEELMELCDKGAICDFGIISSVQKIEQYKIATYRTLRRIAERLGLTHIIEFINLTINEQKANMTRLKDLALSINLDIEDKYVYVKDSNRMVA